jgi:hypothetical protein
VAALALACALAATGCGPEPGVDEPAREGLAIDVAGIDYNVFITRELNLEIPPDTAYYTGPPATPGRALYGIFLKACNVGDEPRETTEEFIVEDNQGTEFEPLELEEDNAFAYNASELAPDGCQPEAGSVAQLGPTAGSMLLFDFSLQSLENRPLELVIGSGEDVKRVELDL